jgi:signal transduction histidine kinase
MNQVLFFVKKQYKLNRNDSLAIFNLNAAECLEKKDYSCAQSLWDRMLEMYVENDDLQGVKNVLTNQFILKASNGEPLAALDIFYEFDSLMRILNEKSSTELEKELEIAYFTKRQEQKAEIAEQKAKNRTIVIWILSFSLVIILPLLFWISFSIKTIKAKNHELNVTHKELATVNDRLERRVEERTAELEERNKRLERYAFATSHKLRKPLANILGLITLFADNQGNDQLIDMLEKSSEELDDAVRHMGEILDRKESDTNQSS